MSAIAKAKSVPTLDATTLTAADTFRETFSNDDEEHGLNPSIANNDVSTASTAPNAPRDKKRIGWMVAGALVIFILGLSIGLATRNNGEETSSASAVAVPPQPSVIVEDSTSEAVPGPSEPSVPSFVLDIEDALSISSDDASGDEPIFEPVQPVGDSALLNPILPELIIPSKPINNGIASPTMDTAPSPTVAPTNEPSASPSKKPTSEPSAEPTKNPSLAPTKSPTDEPTTSPSESPTPKPTSEPTKSPIVPLNLSGWESFNWSGETPSPTSSPTTTEPTSGPTKKPTDSPTPAPTNAPTLSPSTAAPTDSPTPKNPYFMGDSFYTFSEDGVDLDVSTGLTVRLIAKTGSKVQLANGAQSKDSWHTATDAAGVISLNPEDPLNSGYAYLSNSEEGSGDGGVYGLYFDKDGQVTEYKALLTGTTDNCGGGYTPWNTWVSCEEFSEGQCWQIDPISGEAKETELGGDGGRYESVAVDNRNPANPVFFTTEDDSEGALRRFVASGSGWDALHTKGEHSFLNILSDNTFEWTEDLDVGRASASKHFPNSEGIQVHEGQVYFMAKELQRLLILDLETNTYKTEGTGRKFYGEGDFGNQPDQNLFGPTRKYMYFTEDGGKDPGVYARYGTDETYFTMFQGNLSEEDETVGIALSPDHKVFYAALQGHGMVYEFRREDGLPFE